MRVVQPLSIFFSESDDGVVDPCHLRYGARKLDILDHSKVGLTGFFGQPGNGCAPYDHSYISYRWSRAFILSSWGLLLRWICSFLTYEPLLLPLSYKSFYMLFQIVANGCVMSVVTMEAAVLIL